MNITTSKQKNLPLTNKLFSIIHWNANSLKNKTEYFDLFLNLHKPEIISINETKCDNNTANKYLLFNNYTLIHKERQNGVNGAGGWLYLSKKISNTFKFMISTILILSLYVLK